MKINTIHTHILDLLTSAPQGASTAVELTLAWADKIHLSMESLQKVIDGRPLSDPDIDRLVDIQRILRQIQEKT